MATAVAKAKSTDVSTDVLDDIFETAGDGASFDSSEMQIPFVRILQPMSPQLKKGKAEHIEGASQGDIFNNLRVGVFDPLVDVQRRVTKNCVRLRQFEVALDTQSIPRGDEIARGRRKSLIKVLGELEAALEKFDHSIKEFQSNCPRGAGEG